MNTTPDGQFQTYATETGAYIRDHFFGDDQRLRAMVEGMTDEQILHLGRGGHDHKKVYAAFTAAKEHTGQPTVILAKTVKGWTLGPNFEGRNATHQMKKLTVDDLKGFRDRLHLPISDKELDERPPAVLPPGPELGGDPVHARPPQGPRRLRADPCGAREAAAHCRTTRRTRP